MHQARILVADDSRAVRVCLERALSAAGFQVIVACDGFEAVRLAREAEPDLAILDIQMPEMDGYAACDQILQHGSLPIILLTNHLAPHLNTLGNQIGAYLPKPADDETLISTVRKLLQHAAAQTC